MSLPWFNHGEQLCFGHLISAEAHEQLHQAYYADSLDENLAERTLLQVRERYPAQHAIHIALYKFYIAHDRLDDAHKILTEALSVVAKACGIPPDWRVLDSATFQRSSPQAGVEVYLYCLRALSELLLRLGDSNESYRILEKLYEIDPHDRVATAIARELAREFTHEDNK